MNENKFTGKAELYSKYRPSYPEKLIDWLYDMTNAEAVADIGAGTGIFTSALLKKPWSVTAVEPGYALGSQKSFGRQGKNGCCLSGKHNA